MKFDKRVLYVALASFVAGIIWLIAVRFVTVKDTSVHEHANFALYINGQKDEFSSFTFYEEVEACVGDEENDPKKRVHMHNQVNSVVHVHDSGVAWGHFFANLGYALGDNLVKTDNGVYVKGDDGNELKFILNGKEVSNIANRHIDSEDSLLINYGKDSTGTLNQRYDGITKDAQKFNTQDDPASCSGSEKLTFWTRMKRAIGIGE